MVTLLAALSLEERRKVPGLNPERADIILAGAAILDAFMQELDLTAIHVSERGLIMLRKQLKITSKPWLRY